MKRHALILALAIAGCTSSVEDLLEPTSAASGFEEAVLKELAENNNQKLVLDSAGTAFAINANGDFLTSAHVIEGCDALLARMGDWVSRLPVRVKARDENLDLAVLSIPAKTPAFLRFSPVVPEDRQALALIGFPKQGVIRSTPSLTPVRIVHELRDPRKGDLTGIVGDVRRGLSGGPALDSGGRAVGVLKAKINTAEAYRRTGKTYKNLGVLVDARRVVRFLERAQTRYWLDGKRKRELRPSALLAKGTSSVIRVDCMKRS